ncbi:MAG: hypothetical protein Kow0049_19350 [Stanieria sp.]
MKIINFLNRLPPRLILYFSLVLIGLISAIDYVIKIDIALSIFYLVPITLITWFVNQKWGMIGSVASSISWFIADLQVKVDDYWWLPYWNVLVRLGFFIITVSLLAALKKSYEYQKQLARTDSLTRLINRNSFLEILQLESFRSLRYQRPFTLAYLDIDDFKLINDHYGHSHGDSLLKLITQAIQKQIRATDTLARLGGDEFALLLPETNYESAQIVLQRVSSCCQQTTQSEFSLVGLSIGAITFVQPLDSIGQMLQKVDLLMYEVKKGGKNNFKHELI